MAGARKAENKQNHEQKPKILGFCGLFWNLGSNDVQRHAPISALVSTLDRITTITRFKTATFKQHAHQEKHETAACDVLLGRQVRVGRWGEALGLGEGSITHWLERWRWVSDYSAVSMWGGEERGGEEGGGVRYGSPPTRGPEKQRTCSHFDRREPWVLPLCANKIPTWIKKIPY